MSFVFSIRPLRWAIVILGLAVVAFGSVPRRDAAETSFDEADSPVSQCALVALRIRFVPPTRLSVIVPLQLRSESEIRPVHMPILIETRAQWEPPSLLNLLCTFLC
jgi:hypothetical protein